MLTNISYKELQCSVEITNPAGHIQGHWKNGSFYEINKHGLLNWVYANIPFGSTCLDIGANIGNHTMFLGAMGCKVLAMEPEPVSHWHLMANLNLNDFINPVHTMQAAAYSNDGILCINRTDFEGVNHLTRDVGVPCPVIRIDHLPDKYDYIKIDVEGQEQEVLKGGISKVPFAKWISVETENPAAIDHFLSTYGFDRLPVTLNYTHTFVWHKPQR